VQTSLKKLERDSTRLGHGSELSSGFLVIITFIL
jgi:hypothetical protein